jgi:hypothetical protein
MKSYPASCDFMVARPPTYEQSMSNYYNSQNRLNTNFRRQFTVRYPRPIVERESTFIVRRSRTPGFCNIL